MNKLDQIYIETQDAQAFAKAYVEHLGELLQKLDFQAVSQVIELFLSARETGNRIFFIGNGGSAATASHFANDIAIGTRSPDKPFKAISLTDNAAVITAIANDDGYEQIFVQQLQTLLEPGDLVVAISASGNSSNVLKAIEYANSVNAKTVGLTGFDGGELKNAAKHVIHVQAGKGEYGPVEDIHMILDHLIGSYLMRAVLKK